MTEQGEEVIKSLKGEFGVIAVAGMYRTGKSYLLNRMLLNRQKGFSVGPTVNPCTKGLWIWSKPIYGNGENGKRLPMLLIDTEGFGALDEDSNHDIRIFTLSILLSSYFVYNSLGSIDENALQNLNFVINLSKYIHLKNEDKETDPEELANLFPSFLWVLRDFSLQLIDDNGENITPKEYLETVLEGSKSVQDPKNKIRKLIKAYFKDRDCFTMVRPLTNENQLQSLETLEPEKLRPEFLEQILQLRKKVLTRVKVKTLNGKALNSQMYLGLIKNLIGAINSGSVPNIENTWMSMCKVESYKAFEEAEAIYESYLKENLGNVDESLEQIHKDAKDKALELFKKKALGEAANEYGKQLKSKIKEKYSYYVKLQDEETKGKITRVLNKWYSILESRIQCNEFKSIEEIGNDFITLEERLNETFPNYAGRNELFNEFKTKVFSYAGEYFAVKAENEKKFLQEQTNQQILKLTSDLDTVKANYEKENEKKQIILEQNKTEISDLKNEIVKLKETLAVSEKEKEITANTFNSQLTRLKEDFARKMKDSESKRSSNEEKQKDAERKVITIKAECDKEKALLNQKIEHLTKQIDDYAKREKETNQEMKSQLKEQSIAFKDKSDKYETQIKKLTIENENFKEKVIDLESSLTNADILYQNEKKNYDDYVAKTSKETKDLNEKLQNFKKTYMEEKEKMQSEFATKENDFQSEISALKLKIEENEVNMKSIEDTHRAEISKMEREIAILKQENSLLKSQNEELNGRITEQKKYYENIISNLESKAFSVDHEEFQKKIDEVKVYYEEEKKKNEENFEKIKSTLNATIDNLTDSLKKSEINAENLKEEIDTLNIDAKTKIDKLNKELADLQNEKKNLNATMLSSTQEMSSKMKSTIAELEKKLEEKESLHQNEICELNKNSEETLNQLKALFETEKIRLEEKLKEEKSKNEKKLNALIEDYETKIKEQENELKEENENLQNDLQDLDKAHSVYVNNCEHEFEMLHAQLETLDAALKEAKDALNTTTEQSKLALDNATEAFNKERKELQGKIDIINGELNTKEKTIAGLQSKKEQIEKLLGEKDGIISTLKKDFAKEKDDINAKYEELKKKYNELNDSSMMIQLESTRDNALLNQQIEFLNKKNEETQKITEENQKRYEERLFTLRSEVEKDLNEKFDRIKKEKEELEGKLLSKKKEVKELEQNFTKQTQVMSKEKSDLVEQLMLTKKSLDELNENYTKEKEAMEKTIAMLTQENNSFKENLNTNEKSMKTKLAAAEMALAEKTSQYEKDMILWEGKIKFVEQQRDNLKKEQAESNKRFENLIETIQKKGNAEKEKIESATQNAIANLEQKYQKQIKDLQDNHSKLYSELLNNNKELERALKNVTLENEINKNKNINPADLVKKIEEITKEKDILKQNENTIKAEHESRIAQLMSGFEKEKEQLKKKIAEIEKSLRDVEGKRGALLLELEKEKAKWNIEKDNLSTKTGELNDKVASLERKNESLLRENEKLKNEKNQLRKLNMKNDSRYLMYSNQNSSIFNNTSMMKGNDSTSINPTTNRLYSGLSSNYQSQMFKILGNIDLNGSKGDIDKDSVKSGDNKSSGNKKDVTSNPSTNTSNSKDEK